MKRKLAMTENSICMPFDRFSKSSHCLYLALFRQRTPLIKRLLSTFYILIRVKFLQRISQYIHILNVFIQPHNRSKPWLFFLPQILFILQKQIFTSFHNLFIFSRSFSVFSIPDFVYYFTKGLHHMKLIKHYCSLRTVFPGCLNIGLPHIHFNCLNKFPLIFTQRGKKPFQYLIFSSFTYPEYFACLVINNHRKIFTSLQQMLLHLLQEVLDNQSYLFQSVLPDSFDESLLPSSNSVQDVWIPLGWTYTYTTEEHTG